MSNRINGARSGWTRRENVKEFPLKIRCHVQWPNTQSTLDFRAKNKADALLLARGVVNHLVDPMHVHITVQEHGETIAIAEACKKHINQALEEAFA